MPQAHHPPGCEKIVPLRLRVRQGQRRKKVTCLLKDNIHKLTDGLFHKVFDEIAAEYPDIETDHWIIDIGAARLADTPDRFDVIVAPNLYGDIISDIAAQITGSSASPARPTSAKTLRCSRRSTGRPPTSPGRTSPTPRACCSPPS